jgi:ParB-like nuclease domain
MPVPTSKIPETGKRIHLLECVVGPGGLEPLQPRTDGIDPEHVWNLAQVPELWPPLTVAKRGDKYFLLDGFHRFTAGCEREFKTFAVIVLDLPENEDLRALERFPFRRTISRICEVLRLSSPAT